MGEVGGQIHGAYQIVMSASIVRVTLIFSHVQCVRREGYAHTLYCIDESGGKKDRVYCQPKSCPKL